MNSDKRQSGGRFLVKQAVLLVITILLSAFCTAPLIQAVRWTLNPEKLKANLDRANEAVVDVRTKLDVANSKMLMAAGDEESQEMLKRQVEELKRQLELKQQENKHLQNEVVMARLIAELVKNKSAPVADLAPKSDKQPEADQKADKPLDTGQKADKLMQTADKVDKLVTETGQKVDKLVATGKNVWELVIKIFGSLGSVFTGMAFVVSWLRRKREPPRAAVQVASK